MQTTTQIQLDVQQPEYIVVVHAMQQDEQTRYVAIRMTEAGVAFTPPSGTLGVLAIRKPDGEPCFYDSANGEPAVTIEGSTATCLLVPEALQVSGDAPAALVLYNAQGDRLSTFRFLLRIEPTPVPDETVTSSSYYSILTQQIADAIAAGELAQQVIDLTVSASTLPAGSEATVTKTEQGGVFNLAFGIPQGEAGAAGQAATVTVGTVTTLPAGSDATVTNSGTPGAAVFNFGIPEGAAGDGAIYETAAGNLDNMDKSDLAALHAQGYRAVKDQNGATVTLFGLSASGKLSWLGVNEPRGNLLDNASFLVAQAGYGGMHGTDMYVADRWVGVGVASAAGVTGGGVSVTDESGGAAALYQNFYSMRGGAATFFANVTPAGGQAALTVYSLASGAPVQLATVSGFGGVMAATATLPENTVCRVEIKPCVGASGGTAQIIYAGVYAGSYSSRTLPPWEEPDYATEYLKCRRYYNSLTSYGRVVFRPQGETLAALVPSAEMRITPTAITDSLQIFDDTSTWTSIAVNGVEWMGDGYKVKFSTEGTISPGKTYIIQGLIGLNADM